MMVTSSCPTTTRTTEGFYPGITQRAVGVPGGRRTAGVQAGLVRGARRGGRTRHRAGRDAEARREIRPPAARGTADAVSPHRAERGARLVPAPEGPLAVDHPALLPDRLQRGRRPRSAGNPRGGRWVEPSGNPRG